MKCFLIFLLALVSASYGQRQTVMVDTNGGVVFPTNFWEQAPVSTNVQEFIGTNAFNSTNEVLEFLTRRHDVIYPQEETWTPMVDPVGTVTPQGNLWIANSDPSTNGFVELAVFDNPTTDLSSQTNLVVTNANAAHGGYRYNAERNVMYASGRNDRVIGINPTNYEVSVISTNAGAQHRPAIIVGDFMYVSKGGAGVGSAEGLAKIDLTTDTQLTNIAVAPTNATTSAIYRMETNPEETFLAGSMFGLFGSNGVFWTVNLSNFQATITSTQGVGLVFGANSTHAFVAGSPSGSYNLTNHAFTPMASNSSTGVYDSENEKVYFFGEGEIVKYDLNTSNSATYYTGKFGGIDRLVGQVAIDGKIFAIDGSANIYEIDFSPSVSSQTLSATNVSGVEELPLAVNASISNNYPLLITNKDVYYSITPFDTNRNVLNVAQMEAANPEPFRQGQHFTIRNNSASNNINFLRFNGSSITTIPPQQSKTWVLVDTSTTTFTNRWKQIYSREEMGLGAIWLTNTNATNFRTAIGLGTAATNDTAAFQPSSANLTNLSDNNGAGLTNLIASNISGIVSIENGGTGANNITNARSNLQLGETNNPSFNSILLSSGSLTNPALQIGTNAGLLYGTGPNRILLSVDGSTGVFVTTNTISAGTFSGSLSGGSVTIGSGGSLNFGGGANIAASRTNLGLGGGITTNRTFISYDGTNYTTNSVTISNGIITGWTQ
jgi:hypothetical protein